MSKHMKRLAAPRTIRLHRKEKKWTAKASPGSHSLEKSVTLHLIVRDYLDLCDTGKESKQIIANSEIHVNGTPRKNHKFPVGFMDVISVPKLKKDFRMLFDRKGKLTLVPISVTDAKWKLYRIEDKTIVNGNRVQLNLHDGANQIVKKDEYKTGDVLKISFSDKKITEHYPFTKGTISMIIGGSHIGQMANIEDVEVVQSSKSNLAKMKGDTEFSTIIEYVFPIGKTKPVVQLPSLDAKNQKQEASGQEPDS